MPNYTYFATCPRGFESLLAQELGALRATEVRETLAGVHFFGDAALLYRSCLWSRLANKILMPLKQGKVRDKDALYALVHSLAWEEHFPKAASLRVDFIGTNEEIKHSNFGAQVVKDAIVDRLRAKHGERPSVNRDNPDLIINVRLAKGEAHIALDLSGESLHRRGYRSEQGGAPLKENLAAALLIRANWPEIAARGGPLLDPMCGSGTFLIEAALMAADIAPGLLRNQFGFHHWLQFNSELFLAEKEAALAREQAGLARGLPEIRGYDLDARVVHKAEQNIHAAGLDKFVRVSQKAVVDFVKPSHKQLDNGLLICNPPYGERLGEVEALRETYQQLAMAVKNELVGWQCAVFTGNPELAKEMRLRSKRKYKFFNGPIASELLLFDIVDQSEAQLTPRPPQEQDADDSDPWKIKRKQAEKILSDGAQMVLNRINKNRKRLASWVQQEEVECYRVYDADIPEYAAAIDVYKDQLHVQEYAAPASVDENKAEQRFQELLEASAAAFKVEAGQVHAKQRKRNKGKQQYEKRYSGEINSEHFFSVREGAAQFYVNLQDYLDTGLFLDHRPLRLRIAAEAKGKRFLNLFCYTASATVHAALGGATESVSVDMSNTYLDWAQRNFDLNNVHRKRHSLQRADCFEWLNACRQGFDLILLDPPSFSNSKKMAGVLDVQRDHCRLVDRCMDILTPGGALYFSNNLRKFKLDDALLKRYTVEDIGPATLGADFAGDPKIHHCWKLTHKR